MGFDPVSFLLGKQAGSGGGGGGVTVEPLSVSENGTYTAPSGKAYSPVSVAVPERDPYLYENCYALNLSRVNETWTGGPTITIDCSKLDSMASMCNGGSKNPGYRKIRLINLTSAAHSLNAAFAYHGNASAFESIEMDGDLIAGAAGQAVFNSNKSLKSVTGGAINLSAATTLAIFCSGASALETISFVPSSIKLSIPFTGASHLSQESVISIANGLDGTVTGQTLTLDNVVKTAYGSVTGTVTDGIFAADPAGTVTLTDFISTVKGWTMA